MLFWTSRTPHRVQRLAWALVAVAVIAATGTTLPARRLVNLNGHYPLGVPNPAEPSGYGPPGPTALAGYRLAYVADFGGHVLPRGWDAFAGQPGGAPGDVDAVSHVVVSGGMLQLQIYRDPRYGNRWVTAGTCQCGVTRVYGAYFVRSRYTAAGPDQAELLWPASNQWPPEIDFNETGGSIVSTTTSFHWGGANTIVRSAIHIDMTQWHTWGVIWSKHYILYTVDGRVWGSYRVAANIPRVPMTLNFVQHQLCSKGRQCPTKPTQMDVDWVAEYVAR